MSTEQRTLQGEYQAALLRYLDTPDEVGRAQAYDLGHRAVESEIGLLELANIHRSALDELLQGHPDRDAVAAAMEFFTESLSTFDMAQRGFWEAQERAAQEHDIAVMLQQSLLPAELSPIPGIGVAVRYLPAGLGSEVGGDWYDIVELRGDRVGLVVGDVMGHGIRQAAIMGQLRLGLRAYLIEGHALDVVVRRSDALLQRMGDLNTATLVLAVLNLRNGTLTVVNAGHPPPLLVAPDGTADYIRGGHARLLGLPDPVERAVHGPVPVSSGTRLLFYTDGLFEPHERAGRDGYALLRDMVSGFEGSPDELCDRVSGLVDDSPTDDVCLLAVEIE